MTDYKSQGKTFDEVYANYDPAHGAVDKTATGIVTSDIDGNITGVQAGSMFVDYSDLPEPVRNRTVLFDIDQILAARAGSETEGDLVKGLRDMITRLDRPDVHLAGSDPAMEKLFEEMREFTKGTTFTYLHRSPTARILHDELTWDWDFPQRPSGKNLVAPKEGDVYLDLESKIDFSRLEEMLDKHIPAAPRHPKIFKITDLVEDPSEFFRLRRSLDDSKRTKDHMGWPMTPIFVEALPDANVIARAASDTMAHLTSLAAEYGVDIYFGNKTALKTAMYQYFYGAKSEDIDLSKIEFISEEKAKEMVDNRTQKVAIIGPGRGFLADAARKMLLDLGHRSIMADFETLFEQAEAVKADRPGREWESTKLRRGKGHNKFKRKGKK